MAFIDYNEKDDMQSDTHKIIAGWLEAALKVQILCLIEGGQQNIKLFYAAIYAIYSITKNRLPKEVGVMLQQVRDSLYNVKVSVQSLDAMHLETLLRVFLSINEELDKKGLLFKAKTDLDSMVAT